MLGSVYLNLAIAVLFVSFILPESQASNYNSILQEGYQRSVSKPKMPPKTIVEPLDKLKVSHEFTSDTESSAYPLTSGILSCFLGNTRQASPMNIIDIKDLDKAEVARALRRGADDWYGELIFLDETLSDDDIEVIKGKNWSIRYGIDRALKVDLCDNSFDSCGYDNHKGEGIVAAAIEKLKYPKAIEKNKAGLHLDAIVLHLREVGFILEPVQGDKANATF